MMALAPWATFAQVNVQDSITVTSDNGNKDVIDLPESMTSETDSLLHLYNTKRYLKKDKDCNLPDFNPQYDREVYVQRLRQLPTIVEMPYNDVVRTFIDRYASRLRRSVSLMLGASNFYTPIFEQALETYGLPLELKYLPIIESALNPRAVSRAGATGLWQFMISTGKQYGLEINTLVDERCDIVKSSYAAARYLKDLYKIFKDWNLVIAAYNCGPQNVNKAIHRAQGVADYWKIYPYLPRETRGYVPAFIAANYIMNYYCEHNICPMMTDLSAKTDTVMVDKDIHFEQIASVLNIDIRQIRELNPQYRRDIVNGRTRLSSIRLLQEDITRFVDKEQEIIEYNKDQFITKRAEVTIEEHPVYVKNPVTYTKVTSTKGKKRKNKKERAFKKSRKKSKAKIIRSKNRSQKQKGRVVKSRKIGKSKKSAKAKSGKSKGKKKK